MRKEIDVKIMIGIPASGKSTWAKEFLAKNQNYVRLNRDDFRLMLRNEQMCEPKIEDLVTELFYAAVDSILARKLSILIDNTNVKKRYIDDFIAYVETRANVSFRVFDISLEAAIERDKAREKSVGEDVIKRMHESFTTLMDSFSYSDQSRKMFIYKEPLFHPDLPKTAIFDLDGTLAHANGKRGYFDWFKCDRDDLDEIVFKTYKIYRDAGYTIIIVTGRSEEARPSTEEWLAFYGITYQALYMRPADNFKPDTVVKGLIYENEIKGKYNVEVVFEDRPPVVAKWRELGLKVFQVSKGDH